MKNRPTLNGHTLKDWFQTYTGIPFFPTMPLEGEVRIEDIAHALSMICRFGGHTREFYSVAQHSIHVMELLQSSYPHQYLLHLTGLLHDASEAYLGDVVRPLKTQMANYIGYEERMTEVIHNSLEIPNHPDYKPAVKWADNSMLAAERRDLINHKNLPWGIEETPCSRLIKPWTPAVAESRFLDIYFWLRGQWVKSQNKSNEIFPSS